MMEIVEVVRVSHTKEPEPVKRQKVEPVATAPVFTTTPVKKPERVVKVDNKENEAK